GDARERFVKEGLIAEGSETLPVPSSENRFLEVKTSGMYWDWVAGIHLGEALIANYDWHLDPRGGVGTDALWNIDLYGKADGTVLPIMQDFDLANPVILYQP